MKKLLVYPINKTTTPIVRYKNMLDGYRLVSAIPARGYGWEGKDVCVLDGGEPTGFSLGTSFKDELKNCDAVFANGHSEYEAIAHDAGKEIVTCPTGYLDESETYIEKNMVLKEIPVPVVMVMGQGENCQKFDIQLGLRHTFLSNGYKVSQFGTKVYSKLFGFNPLPQVPDISAWKKIYLYNTLFYQTYMKEKPDVMIIGVPGGIMPITSYENGLFGETAMVLATAAKPDVSVLSIYYVEAHEEYLDLQQQYARFRLGINDVFFHASNTKFIDDMDLQKVDYLTLESDFVLSKLGLKMFNALMPNSCEQAYRSVVDKLQQNVCLL